MREYETYKDSMVEWIGEIPSHWKESRIRYEFTVVMGQSPSSENYNDEDVGTPFLQGSSEFGKRHPTHKKSTTQITKLVPKNSLLISVRAPVGDLSTTDQQYCIGRGLCGLIPQSTVRGFEYYLLSGVPEELQSVVTGSTYDSVSTDDVKNVRVFLPPLSEQEEIVSFLDEKTSLIDKIIENKTERIELLEEMKSSLISEVVTKGLNPNVPMKDSGVEWVGKIPSHWKTTKFGYVSTVVTGNTPPKSIDGLFQDEKNEYPWVKPSDLDVSGPVEGSKEYLSSEGVGFSRLVPEGSVLICCIGNSLGKTGMSGRIVTTNQQINSIVPDKSQVVPKYLFFLCVVFGRDIIKWCHTVTIPILTKSELEQTRMIVPPLHEQEQIVSFLDERISLIDEEMSREERSIDYLNELRQSLIHEVITGKWDVRGVMTS